MRLLLRIIGTFLLGAGAIVDSSSDLMLTVLADSESYPNVGWPSVIRVPDWVESPPG